MYRRDYQDIVAGSTLLALGGFAAFHAFYTLRIGTVWQMGPGMFPAAVGVLLALFGLAILVPALFRQGERADIDMRSFVMISLSILAFGILVQPFGLIPAIVALTLIATRADSKLSLFKATILAIGLSVLATLIFQVGLRISLTAIRWPW